MSSPALPADAGTTFGISTTVPALATTGFPLVASSSPTPYSISYTPTLAVSSSPSESGTATTTSAFEAATTKEIPDPSGLSQREISGWIALGLTIVTVVGLMVMALWWWVFKRPGMIKEYREVFGRDPRFIEFRAWPLRNHRKKDDAAEQGLGIRTTEGGTLRGWDSALMFEKHPVAEHHAHPTTPPIAHTRETARSAFVPFPLPDEHQTIEDIRQDVGTLQITNLAPGDISGGETSRASTALGLVHTYPSEYGTPYQPSQPRYMSVGGTGLDTPWAPLRTRKTREAEARRQSAPTTTSTPNMDTLDKELPYPGDSPAHPTETKERDEPEPTAAQETWSASLRSNLYNAFSAVVGSTANLNDTNATQPSDTFTAAPVRRSSPRRARAPATAPRGPRDPSTSSSSVSRTNSESSNHSWTLEETASGRGVVHFHNSPPRDPFADPLHAPPAAHIRGGHLSAEPTEGEMSSSIYSFDSSSSRVHPHPPRLPSIPNLSAQTSSSSEDSSRTVRKSTHRQYYRKRTGTRRTRPGLPSRKSSSQDSATSVGSEMSRSSTADSDALTDNELFARRVLQERRRRVKEVAVGRGKTTRSRATTLSRRARV